MAAKTLEQLADAKIRVTTVGQSRRLFLATRPRFDRVAESASDGVSPDSGERAAGEQAICRRLLRELGVYRLPLAEWITAVAAGGSLPRLAARLVDLPLSSETRKDKRYKAELRKLQEYAQGKYKNATGARRARIAAIGGPGNPYSSDAALRAPLGRSTIRIMARGDWLISQDSQKFSLKGPPPESDPSEPHAIVEKDAQRFIDYIAEETIPYQFMEIERLYSLRIEFSR